MLFFVVASICKFQSLVKGAFYFVNLSMNLFFISCTEYHLDDSVQKKYIRQKQKKNKKTLLSGPEVLKQFHAQLSLA